MKKISAVYYLLFLTCSCLPKTLPPNFAVSRDKDALWYPRNVLTDNLMIDSLFTEFYGLTMRINYFRGETIECKLEYDKKLNENSDQFIVKRKETGEEARMVISSDVYAGSFTQLELSNFMPAPYDKKNHKTTVVFKRANP